MFPFVRGLIVGLDYERGGGLEQSLQGVHWQFSNTWDFLSSQGWESSNCGVSNGIRSQQHCDGNSKLHHLCTVKGQAEVP